MGRGQIPVAALAVEQALNGDEQQTLGRLAQRVQPQLAAEVGEGVEGVAPEVAVAVGIAAAVRAQQQELEHAAARLAGQERGAVLLEREVGEGDEHLLDAAPLGRRASAGEVLVQRVVAQVEQVLLGQCGQN